MTTAEELRHLAGRVATAVGTEVARRREHGFSWSTKSSRTDLVTEIDTWAETEVVSRLRAARPDDGFRGEEGTTVAGSSGITWIIDPVDGTTNLVYDIPGYSVSIAASDGSQVLAGAVFDPVRDEIFTAAVDAGATRNDDVVSVSPAADLATALVGTGFSYRAETRALQASQLERLLPEVRDIRRLGGAALDLCSVACGRLDGYFERGLNEWDWAAGALIAAEAGAVVRTGPLTVASAPGMAVHFASLLERVGA